MSDAGSLGGWKDPQKRMRAALAGGEFVLYCQPIRAFDPAERPLVEVLVRLREEEDALLPPGEFLPVLEQLGMMPMLDAWVMKQVIERHGGPGAPRYALNLSAASLEYPGFAARYGTLATRAGLERGALLFEIEEADLMARTQAVHRFAAAARALGAAIALVGFGRRAESFDAALALRPDFIKVDGTIVRRVLHDPSCAQKVRAVARAAGVLRIGVVAECVESPEVLEALRGMGAGFVQGFGVALPRPMRATGAADRAA